MRRLPPRAALLASVALLVLGACERATIPSRPGPTRPLTSKAPTLTRSYPRPPQQSAPWAPPPSTLPADVLSAAAALFAQGFADPRGCEYRDVEIDVGSVWSGERTPTKTHAWVLPGGARFAVAWNGLIYRARSVGARADLRVDVAAILAANAARGNLHRNMPPTKESVFVSHDELTSLKAMLLLRLNEVALAARVWAAVRDDSDRQIDPYLLAAEDWLWALFDRGLTAHMQGDTALAIESWGALPGLLKQVEARRGAKRTSSDAFSFSFLHEIDALLADTRRRAAAGPVPPLDATALTRLAPRERIPRLINALDQVSARQMGQPGAVFLGADPIVAALIAEGEPAVEPLIDVLENDTRRTRSVQFWRDFSRDRSVMAVHEAAYVALSGILDTSFFEATSTGDHLTARGAAGRRAVARRVRAHWATWRGVSPMERHYRTLADDGAGARRWLAAAIAITRPGNVQVVPSSGAFRLAITAPVTPGQKPALAGEALRTRSPTPSSLLERRLLATMANLGAACELANALAAWDRRAALPRLATFARAVIGAYARATVESRTRLGSCIAALTRARAGAGDRSALDDYGAWIVRTRPAEGGGALGAWLAPMAEHPSAAPVVRAAEKLFRRTSPWVPHFAGGSGLDAHQLLQLDLLQVAAFRAHVLAELDDRRRTGTITFADDSVEVRRRDGSTIRELLEPGSPRLPRGTSLPLRVADEYAAALSSRAGAPRFDRYWPVARRDRALVAMRAWLRSQPAAE